MGRISSYLRLCFLATTFAVMAVTALSVPAPLVLPLVARTEKRQLGDSSAALTSYDSHQQYAAKVLINGQQFYLRVDTGSADTWVGMEGVDCRRAGRGATPISCSMEHLYQGKYAVSEYWRLYKIYRSGDVVMGPIGRATVQVGGPSGFSADNVCIGFSNLVKFNGHGMSGVLGLARREDTSAFTRDHEFMRMYYDPIVDVLCNANRLPRTYTLNLDRVGTGSLSFGSQLTGFMVEDIGGSKVPSARITRIDFGGSEPFDVDFDAIFDSSASHIHLPQHIADEFATHYVRVGYHRADRRYLIACRDIQLRPSILELSFGSGNIVHIDPRDFVIPTQLRVGDQGTELCELAVTRSTTNLAILGVPFLKNVMFGVDVDRGKIYLEQKQ